MGSASLAAACPNRDDNTPPARRAEGLKLFKRWNHKKDLQLSYPYRMHNTGLIYLKIYKDKMSGRPIMNSYSSLTEKATYVDEHKGDLS